MEQLEGSRRHQLLTFEKACKGPCKPLNRRRKWRGALGITALIKKGLRPFDKTHETPALARNHCPDQKGIKTPHASALAALA